MEIGRDLISQTLFPSMEKLQEVVVVRLDQTIKTSK